MLEYSFGKAKSKKYIQKDCSLSNVPKRFSFSVGDKLTEFTYKNT